jgi:succinate dehydrogenase/fumarate reductase flavoprotein subunit
MNMETERIVTDVLCVGGGIAGLMAGIRAGELGARVVIAEKGATRYSGSARIGNDHFWCYLPEFHGPDLDAFIKECMITQLGNMTSNLGPTAVRTWLEHSYDIVKLWDSWGIPMKHNGEYHFSGHSFPGRVMTHLKYKGKNQKSVLTEQVLKRGARIMDRVMIFELLWGQDGVTGAFGVDTREGRLIEFRAKSVILGTGAVVRLYPGMTPAIMGNNTRPFTLTGDGRSMAYRVGAELVNVELFSRHAGVKNFCRSGQATWAGVCKDPEGKPIGKYVDKPNIKYGDIIIEVDKQIFERYQQAGRGPVYMDCTGLSESDYAYLVEGLLNEGNIGLLEHLKEEGVDLRMNSVEFSTYEFRYLGRIVTNEKAETSVPGLYNAGEESTFSISGAAVFGWIGGEEAARYSRKNQTVLEDKGSLRMEPAMSFISSLQSGAYGYDWRDANLALQNTLVDYAGSVKSEATLTAGLAHLRRLRKKIDTSLRAHNPWELARCLEVRNLYDLAEMVFLAALERKESRGMFQRSDYPYTDPLLNGRLLISRQVDGKPVTAWREVPR